MGRVKLKQILSNLSYDSSTNQLTVSGSDNTALIISGSATVVSNSTVTGSLSIQNLDTFGDTGSFDTIDLGNY